MNSNMKNILTLLFLLLFISSCAKNDPEFEAKVHEQKKEIIELNAAKKSAQEQLASQQAIKTALENELAKIKNELSQAEEETNNQEQRRSSIQDQLAEFKDKDVGPDKVVLHDGKEYLGSVLTLEGGSLSFYDEETVEEIKIALSSVKKISFRDPSLLPETN